MPGFHMIATIAVIAAITEKKKKKKKKIYFVAQRPPKLLKDERFERFSQHRSIVDLQQTLEI